MEIVLLMLLILYSGIIASQTHHGMSNTNKVIGGEKADTPPPPLPSKPIRPKPGK